MTRTDIKDALRRYTGKPFLSLNDICKALSIGKDKASTILIDTDYIDMGKGGRRYLDKDIADAFARKLKR